MGSRNKMLFYGNTQMAQKRYASNFLSLCKEKSYDYENYQSCISYIISFLPLLLICVIHLLINVNVDSFLLNICPILGFDGWGIVEPYLPYCIRNLINEEIVYTYLSYICPLLVFIYFNFIETKYLFFTNIVNFILERILGIEISHVTSGVNSFPTLYDYLRKL
ncbi:site-2 protease S2P [Plasmodium brasilianum]|uniref:Site-2 protease S2P n=1 Tax=Plasmodium brasilianum TaxID=5824 RepID=A0ACB9Y1U7_PLABR|nr:site-2 protease S2P [Plasmodium brasilianum]